MPADVHEVRQLAADLTRAGVLAPAKVRPVLQKGALNIKRDAQRRISGHPHFPGLPSAITYDTKTGVASAEAEIGYDKGRRQGPLGNIAEYGTRNNAPIPALGPALAAEAPRFEEQIAKIAAEGLGL